MCDRACGSGGFRRLSRIVLAALLLLASRAGADQDGSFRIDASNVAKFRELLPASVYERVQTGQYSFPVVPVDPKRFRANYTDRFWEASAANAGKYEIDPETGGLAEAPTGEIPTRLFGLPFPTIDPEDPHAGTKIVHNYRLRKMQSDGYLHEFDLVDVTLEGDVLRSVRILLSQKYFVGTTSPPPDELPDNTESRQLAAALAPKDLEGVGVLTWRFNDWTTWDHMWAYLPTIRRVRRVRSSTRGDRIPGFEVQGDDADCYDNKTTYFEWKLVGGGEIIGPLGTDSPYAVPLRSAAKSRLVMDLPKNPAVFEQAGAKGAPWWTVGNAFVRRPVWIVEGRPRDPYYESGKIVLYVDRDLYHGYYKISYTKAGELYRTNFCGQAWGKTADGSFAAPTAVLMLGVNEIENRGTPAGRFTRETFERDFPSDWFTAAHLDELSRDDEDDTAPEERLTPTPSGS